jgi:sugar lactone lactonase YvrE
MKISPPVLIVDAHATLGEDPAWDASRQVLYWVDIHAGHLHVHDGNAKGDEVIAVDGPLGCVAPTRRMPTFAFAD